MDLTGDGYLRFLIQSMNKLQKVKDRMRIQMSRLKHEHTTCIYCGENPSTKMHKILLTFS